MSKYNDFLAILKHSMRYEFLRGQNGVLELTGYFSGKRVKLDLSLIDEEMFEQLVVEDDEGDQMEDEL